MPAPKEPEAISVAHLIRKDPILEQGDIRPLERIITGPLLTQVRQELADLRSDIDVGKDNSASSLTRVGIGYYLLGQHVKACEYLSKVNKSGPARFYYALSLMSLEQFAEADEQFQKAADLGYDPVQCHLLRAGAIRQQGKVDEAEAVLKKIAKEAAGRAEYSYQMGCIWSDRGDTYRAIEYFERAADMDPHHSRALFRLAAENSNRGNDEDAIRLYEQSLSKPPFYVGSLLNLGLLYEDRENYPAAAFCFRKVLESNPLHHRARLYLRDIEATSDMYYDEESARQMARLEQLLSRPVTDFELSVRSRNCLESMNIRTLGELTRISEQDLLAGKNFGETSLHEIREMMSAHGLMIGQNLRPSSIPDYSFMQQALSPAEQAQLTRPISDLNLSVRARKCMSRLGITTLGELVQRTPDELLSSRNFGVTSLNEVRAKLGEIGMKLRND
jgi:DNA-directed RNA polymerase subunit alpha